MHKTMTSRSEAAQSANIWRTPWLTMGTAIVRGLIQQSGVMPPISVCATSFLWVATRGAAAGASLFRGGATA